MSVQDFSNVLARLQGTLTGLQGQLRVAPIEAPPPPPAPTPEELTAVKQSIEEAKGLIQTLEDQLKAAEDKAAAAKSASGASQAPAGHETHAGSAGQTKK